MRLHNSLRFEGFILDQDRLCLHGPTGQANLRRKSFEVLRYLVQNAGRVVSKEELITAVWPNVTVGDDSLTQCVSEVRHALGDQGHRIIRTIARRGYLVDVPVVSGGVGPTGRLVSRDEPKCDIATSSAVAPGNDPERRQLTE